MGSKGSLHINVGDVKTAVEKICSEYQNNDSFLNKDKTHNGFGKPFIVVGENFLSIYDGSFAVYGDIEREAKLFSDLVGKPIMGITNAGGDMASFVVAHNNTIVVNALNMDYEWVETADVDTLIKTMELPFNEKFIQELFLLDEPDEFIAAFHKLTKTPYFIYRDKTFEKYVSTEVDLPNITVYKQIMPYNWEEDFDYIK